MRLALLFLALATPAIAQHADPASCFGEDPDWTLEIEGTTATLDYQRASDLTLMLSTSPEGFDWPQAYTFIGRGDSAIVIREATQRDNSSKVRVLTQRGETPLLLVGKCYPR